VRGARSAAGAGVVGQQRLGIMTGALSAEQLTPRLADYFRSVGGLATESDHAIARACRCAGRDCWRRRRGGEGSFSSQSTAFREQTDRQARDRRDDGGVAVAPAEQ